MKKVLFMMFILASLSCLSSCSKDKEDDFNYPMETVYGTWEGTAIYSKGEWIDITHWWYEDFQFSITFYSDGKYYGRGAFGTGSGTYKANGNTITTYVDGEIYLTYDIISLTNEKAELTMYDKSGDSMRIKVAKKK